MYISHNVFPWVSRSSAFDPHSCSCWLVKCLCHSPSVMDIIHDIVSCHLNYLVQVTTRNPRFLPIQASAGQHPILYWYCILVFSFSEYPLISHIPVHQWKRLAIVSSNFFEDIGVKHLTQNPQSVVADKLLDRELHQPKDFGFGLQLTHDFESLLQNINYWPFKADLALY